MNRTLRRKPRNLDKPFFKAVLWGLVIYAGWLWLGAFQAESPPFADIKKQIYSRLVGER